MNKVKSKCDKAKAKCASKIAKGKAKVAKKCAKACALAFALLVVCGCQQVPSRSQTLNIRDCEITIYGGCGETNGLAAVEIGTQAMSIENSGTESLTPTQTTDTKPDVDVSVGAAKGGGILETAAAAGVQKLLAPSASATGVGSTATVSSSSCEGGNCTYDGCTDGSCTPE